MSRIHLDREIGRLKASLLSLSAIVEESVVKAVRSVKERDQTLATEVRDSDDRIDQMEVEVEEECLKILALHQPVASDLRFIIAALKINNDLERIGDLAANIASRAVSLAELEHVVPPFDLDTLTQKTEWMLRKSLAALVNLDGALAREVSRTDEQIDAIHRGAFERIQEQIRNNPRLVNQMILYLSVSRNLERIADQTTNIAEDVIYMIEGSIVRHGRERWDDTQKNR